MSFTTQKEIKHQLQRVYDAMIQMSDHAFDYKSTNAIMTSYCDGQASAFESASKFIIGLAAALGGIALEEKRTLREKFIEQERKEACEGDAANDFEKEPKPEWRAES